MNDSYERSNMKIRGYGLGQIIYLAVSLLCTKINYPAVRLIRLPFFFRVRGWLTFGQGFTSGRSLRIDVHSGGHLSFGTNVQINDNCQIACAGRIVIGDNVLIASKVFISDHDHDFNSTGTPMEWALKVADVSVEDGCWIGNGVSILKGVNIGRSSIVGAGSVVTHSFPEYSIIAGSPAKLIGNRQMGSACFERN